MAKIKFTVSFKTTIEVNQRDLKLQDRNGERVSPIGLSPFTIREGIENGDLRIVLADHIDVVQIDDVVADFQESSFE